MQETPLRRGFLFLAAQTDHSVALIFGTEFRAVFRDVQFGLFGVLLQFEALVFGVVADGVDVQGAGLLDP